MVPLIPYPNNLFNTISCSMTSKAFDRSRRVESVYSGDELDAATHHSG